MKNERLMDALGNVSPALVAEAAPGNLPASAKRPIRPLRMLIAAAIVIAIMMVSVLGMTISAEEQGPVLQEVPIMILEEDFERCRRVMYSDEIRAYDSTDEIANRLLSFVFDGSEMFDVPAVLQSITKAELEELLHTLYQSKYFAMSVVSPL